MGRRRRVSVKGCDDGIRYDARRVQSGGALRRRFPLIALLNTSNAAQTLIVTCLQTGNGTRRRFAHH